MSNLRINQINDEDTANLVCYSNLSDSFYANFMPAYEYISCI